MRKAPRTLKERVADFFRRLDANKDGKVAKAEFRGASEEVFNVYDRNQDGALSEREVTRYIREQLELAKEDLGRVQGLLDEGAVTQSAADSARTAYLTQLLAFQETTNSLALIPTQRRLLEAKAARAQRDLERTAIRAEDDSRSEADDPEPEIRSLRGLHFPLDGGRGEEIGSAGSALGQPFASELTGLDLCQCPAQPFLLKHDRCLLARRIGPQSGAHAR